MTRLGIVCLIISTVLAGCAHSENISADIKAEVTEANKVKIPPLKSLGSAFLDRNAVAHMSDSDRNKEGPVCKSLKAVDQFRSESQERVERILTELSVYGVKPNYGFSDVRPVLEELDFSAEKSAHIANYFLAYGHNSFVNLDAEGLRASIDVLKTAHGAVNSQKEQAANALQYTNRRFRGMLVVLNFKLWQLTGDLQSLQEAVRDGSELYPEPSLTIAPHKALVDFSPYGWSWDALYPSYFLAAIDLDIFGNGLAVKSEILGQYLDLYVSIRRRLMREREGADIPST